MKPTDPPVRSVFDCNVFLQAMANPARPAGACFSEVQAGRISLFVSRSILAELAEVASRTVLVPNSIYPQLDRFICGRRLRIRDIG